MQNDTETNTGWWVEKPVRLERPSSYAPLAAPVRPVRRNNTWLGAGIVVTLMVAFLWAIKALMGW